jgi:hypothetical protein
VKTPLELGHEVAQLIIQQLGDVAAQQSKSRDANGTSANCPIEPPAVTTPSATERFLGGVCRLMAPKLGPNPAAAMPIPQITLPSVKTRSAVAGSGALTSAPKRYALRFHHHWGI